MNKNTLIYVSVIVILAKSVAFIRELVLSYYFGMTELTDAFNIAYTIPITIVGFVATAINTSYIPIFHKAESEKGLEEANHFSNTVLYVVFLISALTFILIEVFATPLVTLFASGFDENTAKTATTLTRYMGFSVFLITYNNLIAAFVQLKNKYYTVIYGNIIFYFISILGIVAASIWSISWMALGVVFGYLLESLLITLYAIREKFNFMRLKNLRDPYFKSFVILVLPILVGIFASDINMIVDKTLASRFQGGSISALSYAHKITEAIISIFVTSIIQLAYPRLSKAVYNRDKSKVSEQVLNDFTFLFSIIIPITFLILFWGKQITDLLFLRGKFTKSDSYIVYIILLIYGIGIIPSAVRKYIVRLFYSYGDSKTPAYNSLIVIAINIIFSIVFSFFYGLNGIAMGSTISIYFGAIRLIIKARKLANIKFSKLLNPSLKAITASIIATLVSIVTYTCLHAVVSSNIGSLLSISTFVIAYLVFIKIFKQDHLLTYIKQ